MDKIQTSIAVIGFQKEDSGMYPHLSDFLYNLRASFEEVIYFCDDDRGEHFYLMEYYFRTALSALSLNKLRTKNMNFSKQINPSGTSEDKRISIKFLSYLIKKTVMYFIKQLRLIWKIRTLKFRCNNRIIIAIDHTATFFAAKYTKDCPIVFWSFDILSEDAPWRIKNGFLEKLITSNQALQADVLMIQDGNRKDLLEKSVGKVFEKTFFLPVGLNDSEYCRIAAEKRTCKGHFDRVKIIQSGLLSEIRLTVELIDIYQQWPSSFELFLHGKLCGNLVDSKINHVDRKPIVSSDFYDVNSLVLFLDTFDIGFVGYGETDSNHRYIENASAQLVSFFRLGIPVIVCGAPDFNAFIEKYHAGVAVTSLNDMVAGIDRIIDNYAFYSGNARQVYQYRFNLSSIFESYLIPSIAAIR